MRVTQVLMNFIRSESFGGIFLGISTIMALIVANSPLSHIYHTIFETPFGFQFGEHFVGMELKIWVNDVLMSFFFLLVGFQLLEVSVAGRAYDFF